MAKKICDNAKVAIHNGVFHADDVFAVASMRILNPTIEVIRTRDENVWALADFRVDVGQKFNPETGDFDHHQLGFNERHPSPNLDKYSHGPKKSSVGLIWDTYGHQIVSKVLDDYDNHDKIDFIYGMIVRNIIAPIDAIDNGEGGDFFIDTGVYKSPSIVKLIQSYNPTWMEPEVESDTRFHEVVDFAISYLKREITRNLSVYASRLLLLEQVKHLDSSGILVLDQFVPWVPIFTKYHDETKHVKMVVFPSSDGWMFQSPYYSAKADGDAFSRYMPNGKRRRQKYPAPEHLCGAVREHLIEKTGIADATFVHSGGFLGGAQTKEGAIQLAMYVINNQDV